MGAIHRHELGSQKKYDTQDFELRRISREEYETLKRFFD
jgi:hypothetical protein